MRRARIGLIAILVSALAACGSGHGTNDPGRPTAPPASASAFRASSSAFADGQRIPKQYTCDGTGVSPPLEWSTAPEGTQQVALIVDDPDAPGGTFVHWVIWGLPPEGGLPAATVPSGAVQGRNGAGTVHYTPPCPPKGKGVHHYNFTFSAVSHAPDVPPSATAAQLREAIANVTLATTTFVGTYSR
jgi:Raf kinase inhibitor-like YbhB/YbcL family protein